MNRNTDSFYIEDISLFKQQMLDWAQQFSICCFLDNHLYADKYHSHEWLLAVGAIKTFSPVENILQQLHQFYSSHHDWLFGHISYDLKNETENLSSHHTDHIGFPDIFLFQPETIITLQGNHIVIESAMKKAKEIYQAITDHLISFEMNAASIKMQPRISNEHYIDIIEKLRQHILRGDCYEINFCMEYYAEETCIHPLTVYKQLTEISPNPFSCFYKLKDKYLLCASPERFLKKRGTAIYSQPIKGTAERNNKHEDDDNNKKILEHSAKNRSENVMVVDLVRNDLSKICKEGTVIAEELFGIYSFPQVHQMISTIKGELTENIGLAEILKATFPMGSMTGAPKKRVMQLIEQYEQTKRGVFSGAVGYITPQKDFDFNVVIRSIMYNAAKKYVSYQVGGAITFYSNAQEEYAECLLKAKAMEQVLGNK